MKTSANGLKFLKNEEGVKLTVYKDTKGNLTVGCGHKVLPADKLKLGDKITQERCDKFLAHDLATIAEGPINKLKCASKLSQNQFDALVSIVFNGGPGVLATGDMKTMFAYAQIFPDYKKKLSDKEIDHCSRLVSKAFSYDRNLKPRRNRESTLFCKGRKYTHKYNVYTL